MLRTTEEAQRQQLAVAEREQWRREAALRIYCASVQSPMLDRIAPVDGGLPEIAVKAADDLLATLEKTRGR